MMMNKKFVVETKHVHYFRTPEGDSEESSCINRIIYDDLFKALDAAKEEFNAWKIQATELDGVDDGCFMIFGEDETTNDVVNVTIMCCSVA